MDRDPVGGASTQYDDWRGTVALDNPDEISDDVYALAGIDREEWDIVGLDLVGSYDKTFAFVYAVEASRISEFEDWRRAAEANNGVIPVTQFTLHDDDIAFKLLAGFKRWDIHARLKSALVDQGIDIVVEREVERGNGEAE